MAANQPTSTSTAELLSEPLSEPPVEPIAKPLDVLAELVNEESRTLLDTIDSLRDIQVGNPVSLPQIIVVGDQSTGKSSVLEAISRVRFSVDAKQRTRFATELVLQRAERTRVTVSIRYADLSRDDDAEPFRRTEFDDIKLLPSIIDEARAKMGIGSGQNQKRYSKDVLRVEIAHPDVYTLTLVDLPGISHHETAFETEEDKILVDRLINSYLQQQRSIILTVVTANNHLAMLEAASRAQMDDVQRNRTVCVVTKPELLQVDLTQKSVDRIIQKLNRAYKFSLGWFVLRNLSEKQKQEGVTFDERDALEAQFFETAPGWSSFRQENRGVHNLRNALSNVLWDHMKTSLPALVEEIETKLQLRQDELRCMGRPKQAPDELRSYMLHISKEFCRLAGDGINGRYADDFFDAGASKKDEGGPRKLRANLRKLNRAFYAVLKERGAAQTIILSEIGGTPVPVITSAESRSSAMAVPDYLQHLVVQYRNFRKPELITRRDFERDFEAFAANNQGRELSGLPSSDLAINLFRRQAKPWRGIARFHLDLVLTFSKSFVEAVFAHVIGGDSGPRTLAVVLNTYVDPFFEAKRAVLEAKLDEILRPYTSGNGLPLETEFRAALHETAVLRFEQRVASALEREYSKLLEHAKGGDKMLLRDEIKYLVAVEKAVDLNDSEFGTEQVVDNMMTCYDMSRSTFTENVINLVVENCLICDLPDILTASTIFKMSDGRLCELAAESKEVAAKRTRLQEEVQILEQALARYGIYKARTSIVLPSAHVHVTALASITKVNPPAKGAVEVKLPPTTATASPPSSGFNGSTSTSTLPPSVCTNLSSQAPASTQPIRFDSTSAVGFFQNLNSNTLTNTNATLSRKTMAFVAPVFAQTSQTSQTSQSNQSNQTSNDTLARPLSGRSSTPLSFRNLGGTPTNTSATSSSPNLSAVGPTVFSQSSQSINKTPAVPTFGIPGAGFADNNSANNTEAVAHN